MELADCFTPEELVSKIFSLSPNLKLPIPITAVAKECGILLCAPVKLEASSFTGALISDSGKDYGVILYKAYPQVPGRERFTIAHELGHHLLQHHNSAVFCGQTGVANEATQEAEQEADSFATQLLMPRHLIESYLQPKQITLELIKELSVLAVTSFSATAKRSCALLSGQASIIFIYSKDGLFRYADSSNEELKKYLSLSKGDQMPENSCVLNMVYQPESFTKQNKIISSDWFYDVTDENDDLVEQVYSQENGYAVTLISVNRK